MIRFSFPYIILHHTPEVVKLSTVLYMFIDMVSIHHIASHTKGSKIVCSIIHVH